MDVVAATTRATFQVVNGTDDGDPIRLLHRRSEIGYTPFAGLAMPDEPEAISAEEQTRQSVAARHRRAHELRGDWRVTRRTILAAIAGFREVTHGDRQVADGLRVLERGIARLDRHLDELAR